MLPEFQEKSGGGIGANRTPRLQIRRRIQHAGNSRRTPQAQFEASITVPLVADEFELEVIVEPLEVGSGLEQPYAGVGKLPDVGE